VVDKSDKESGLNEAVKLLSIGDKAKLILPSHLAYGLLGDFDKIPPQSILLIDVQLNKIK
jgi:peptidylprolyl isomerase